MTRDLWQSALTPQRFLAGRPLPRLGLGCARVGSFNNPSTLRQSRELLAAAIEAGVVLFDTADIYGQGDSEHVIGQVIRRSAASPLVVTKAGYHFSWKMRLVRPLKPMLRPFLRRFASKTVSARRAGALAQNFSSAHLQRACAAACRRLGVSRLDAFLLHDPSAEVLREGEAVSTLRSLRRSGAISAFGASIDNKDALVAALEIDDLEVLELPAALFWELGARERADLAAHEVIILLREVLRAAVDRSIVATLREALADPLVGAVIVGTTNRRHLEECAAVCDEAVGHA